MDKKKRETEDDDKAHDSDNNNNDNNSNESGEESDDEDEPCDICGSHGTLILCDGDDQKCAVAVHLSCYKPGTIAPEDEWFCDRCQAKKSIADAKVICCDNEGTSLRRTTPIPGNDVSFIHVNCAIWNRHIQMSKGDEPIKVEPYLLQLKHPCKICSSKTGLRVKCCKGTCQNWFHVSCAIKQGHLKPKRSRSAKNDGHLLVCPEHAPGGAGGNAGRLITKDLNFAAADEVTSPLRPRPGSAGSAAKKVSRGGDLKEWEANRADRRAQQQASGGNGTAKRRVVDSDVSDSERSAKKLKKQAGKKAVDRDGSDFEKDSAMDGVEDGEDEDDEEDEEEVEEGDSLPKGSLPTSAPNDRRSSAGNGVGFPASSKLASEIFGKDTIASPSPASHNVPRINASAASAQSRRVSEALPVGLGARDGKSRPGGGLVRPRDGFASGFAGAFFVVQLISRIHFCRSNASEAPADTINRIIRAQEKFNQELRGIIPNLQKPMPQRTSNGPSAASALDSLLDKAHEATELTSLRKEIESLKAKMALQDTCLVTLRSNLVFIFNQLKLSAVTPDETSVDDYVAYMRDLMKS
ncbi:hypothetical protein CcCBS67573_g06121 [Chytriomyces confervae]|uniref:PHD-type domain-containing protein n=1 Tax=Chytriomyces confervae TaxID=246404 RepID=A0A507F8A0_9FUNG|nr:hypothetical protein CcCBS67573_g06121 [Chytriomyces confervae]